MFAITRISRFEQMFQHQIAAKIKSLKSFSASISNYVDKNVADSQFYKKKKKNIYT